MNDPYSEIHAICYAMGINPPKVVEYSNGTLIAIRNGDGQRVAAIIPLGASPQAIKDQIATLYKIKPENQARPETLAKVFSPEEIRAFQEGKKAAQRGE